MALFPRRPRRLEDYDLGPSPRKVPSPEDLKKAREARRLTLLLIVNTLVALLIYFGCASLGVPFMPLIYIGLAAVLLLVYVIYNRGFSLRGVTPEMLPDSIDYEERRRKIMEAAERLSASRWMLILIIPLVVALLADTLYLFLLQDLLASLENLL